MTDFDSHHSFPLSAQQKHVWDTDLSVQGSEQKRVVNTQQVWLNVRVPYDVFHRALQTVWSRHGVFLHTYQQQPGLKYPQQTPSNTIQLAWHQEDGTGEESNTGEESIGSRYALSDKAKHFLEICAQKNHSAAIWFAQNNEAQHCLLSIPAVSCDQPSMVLLIKEVNALLQGHDLPELDSDYEQFVHWQDECLDPSDEDFQAAQSHWLDADAGQAQTLAIARRVSTHGLTQQAHIRYSFEIPAAFHSILNTRDASLNEAVLTAVYGAFFRLTESSDIIVNQRFACRPFEELDHLAGCLEKPISLQLTRFENDDFWTLLQRLQRQCEAIDSHAEYYASSQALNHHAVAEVSLLETPSTAAPVSIVEWSQENHGLHIMCMLHEANDDNSPQKATQTVTLQASFDAHMYLESEMHMLFQRIESCLVQVNAQPDILFSNIRFNLAADQQRLQPGDTVATEAMPHVISRFENFVASNPQAIALCDADKRYDYQQLNNIVNQVAIRLIEVTKNTNSKSVPCYLERNADMVIAMLACLKAGCAFVPLEASKDSAGQINTVLQSLNYDVIITQSPYVDRLPVDETLSENNTSVLLLDQICSDQTHDVNSATYDNPAVVLNPNSLAYVIYTSGTTGAPKGVPVSHCNLSNYCDSLTNTIDAQQGWQWACVSTLAADLGYTAVFGALTSGGTLHVLPQYVVTDERAFSTYLVEHTIDVIKMVPSHLQTLWTNLTRHSDNVSSKILPNEVLILGGETFHLELNNQLQTVNADLAHTTKRCRIFNHYGPSETTIGCFMGEVLPHDGEAQGAATIPIGKPLYNTAFAVVDEQGEPVASYMAGELIVSGAGITKGYINASDSEAARYAERDINGQCQPSFATGDKVRVLNDGRIEFIGRIDQQVKLRGFRVELGAIESVLLRHEYIDQLAVAVTANAQSTPRLVAYYVCAHNHHGDSISETELREQFCAYLESYLPSYMCPTQWISLSTLPLTRNGKIDRRQLPDPDSYLHQESAYQAPETNGEIQLANIWKNLLNIPRCGRHDHFFDLGGNSLIATQVVAQLRAELKADIAVADLFDYPILSEQARYLESRYGNSLTALDNNDQHSKNTDAEPVSAAPVLTAVDVTGHYPLSFSQQRLWFLDQLNPASAFYNVPAGLRFKGEVNLSRIEQSLCALWNTHDSLRTRITYGTAEQGTDHTSAGTTAENTAPQQYLDREDFVFAHTDLSAMPSDEARKQANALFEQEAQRPFNLHTDRLMRAHCIKISDNDVLVVVVLHHIISDAWSTDLLLREFAQSYNGQSLVRPEFSGVDFGEWQRHYLDEERRHKELIFWKNQLHGAPQYLPLPLDRPRPEYQTYNGARYYAAVPSEQVQAINGLARSGNYSQFMLLMAAFKLALSEWTQQSDICLTIPIAGRNHTGIERSIGLFLNTLVLRTPLDSMVTVHQLLDHLRQTALAAFDHQALPFDQLIRELDIERATQYTPFNQVCFNLLNTPLGKSLDGLNTHDLQVSLETSNTCTAKYDIEWILAPEADGRLGLCVEYNRDLFDESSIQTITDMFLTWCEKLPCSLDAVWHQVDTHLSAEQSNTLTHYINRFPDVSRLLPVFSNSEHIIDNTCTLPWPTIGAHQDHYAETSCFEKHDLVAILAFASTCYLDGNDDFVVMFNNTPICIEQSTWQADTCFGDLVTAIEQQYTAWHALEKTPYVMAQCQTMRESASMIISMQSVDEGEVRDEATHTTTCALSIEVSANAAQKQVTLSLLPSLTVQVEQMSGFLARCLHVQQQLSHVNNPQACLLGDISWIDTSEQQQLVDILSSPVSASTLESQTVPLLERLHRMERDFGDLVAVHEGSNTHKGLTFRELNQQSNQLAHALLVSEVASKAASETTSETTSEAASHAVKNTIKVIAVLANPGGQWVTMILAAIKAGFAYLPIDARLPASRIQRILDDAQCYSLWFDDAHEPLAKLVEQEANTASTTQVTYQRYSTLVAQNTHQPVTAPDVAVAHNQPLYVIYTSGSTGEPKGAVVSHANESNLIHWYQQQYNITRDDNLLIISALAFDLTQKNIFVALTQGATLVFPESQLTSHASHFDADAAVSLIEHHKVSLVNCAPSSFYAIVSVCDHYDSLSSLRYVLFGGEAIDISRLSGWLSSDACTAKLVNMYGPTECTDIACAYTVERWADFADVTDSKMIPIGRPNTGVQLYVMDQQQRLLPRGVVGELVIAGAGVGLGYINNPEQTQKAFLDDALSFCDTDASSTKMYRTGDRVYLNEQGDLVFCGRLDHQIKHRGFRIELGAIQRQLQLHERIEQCAVVKVTHKRGVNNTSTHHQEGQLVAFYQCAQNDAPDAQFNQVLTCFLAEQLPSYMLPERWVSLAQMPVNRNGKLDLNALVQLAEATEHDTRDSAHKPLPTSATEKWLAQLWTSLLAIDVVHVNDDFFELGGHSLLATQLVSRIRKESGLSVALPIIFEHSELASLAAAIDQLGTGNQNGRDVNRPVLQAISQENTGYPLSFAQQRLWFVQNMNVDDSRYNMTSLLSITQQVDTHALEQACLMLMQRHSVLRTRFAQDSTIEAGVCQIIDATPTHFLHCLELNKSLELDAQQAPQDFIHQASALAESIAGKAFILSESPLWRVTLISDGDATTAQQHVLCITLHHIAADGWSMSLLIRELMTLYQHYLHHDVHQPVPLPSLSHQYADYAQWQRELLQGAHLETLSRYWQEHLAGAADVLDLNTDRPRLPNASFDGQRLPCELSSELTTGIKRIARAEGVTPYMLMLAAFNVALYEHTQQVDMVVGTDLANRNQHEIEELIGFFVNVLPIRSKLMGNPTFTQLLSRVKVATLGAYAHQDMPFDKLVEVINPERSNAHHPLFQVLFVLQNTPQASIDQRAMAIEVLPQKNEKTRFDLGLFLDEQTTHNTPHITGHWSFSSALFDKSTIEKLNRSWLTILQVVVDNSALPLNQIMQRVSSAHQPANGLNDATSKTHASSGPNRREQRRARMQGLKSTPSR